MHKIGWKIFHLNLCNWISLVLYRPVDPLWQYTLQFGPQRLLFFALQHGHASCFAQDRAFKTPMTVYIVHSVADCSGISIGQSLAFVGNKWVNWSIFTISTLPNCPSFSNIFTRKPIYIFAEIYVYCSIKYDLLLSYFCNALF